jgi:hypothetical protein
MLQFYFNNRVTHLLLVNYLIISHNQKIRVQAFEPKTQFLDCFHMKQNLKNTI